jgi:hypothetical protein
VKLDLHEVESHRQAAVALDEVVRSKARHAKEHRRAPALTLREALFALRHHGMLLWTCGGNMRSGVVPSDNDFAAMTSSMRAIELLFEEVA